MKEVTQIATVQITHIYHIFDEDELMSSDDILTVIKDGTSADDVVFKDDVKYFIRDDA